MPPLSLAVGLDIGTTSVKAALWRVGPHGLDGLRDPPLATARLHLPPLQRWQGLPVQDAEETARVAEAAVAALGLAAWDRAVPEVAALDRADLNLEVAFTTQRDTLLMVDALGRPLTPLLSWRERRHLEDAESRQQLLSSAALEQEAGTRDLLPLQLEQWLLHRWRTGVQVPGLRGTIPGYAGGDKNCEYLALGAVPHHPSVAVISLGSAITLGVAVSAVRPPVPVPGTVVSFAAGEPRDAPLAWNVETGILSGMPGLEEAAALAGVEVWEGPIPGTPEAAWVCIPWFGGALDDLEARGGVWPAVRPGSVRIEPSGPSATGGLAGLTPPRLARVWAQGVATELARLAPRVEEVTGVSIGEFRVTGGGVARGGDGGQVWAELFRAALGRPIRVVNDPWAGCRGAVMAVARREDVSVRSLESPQPRHDR
jgi:sugar (pentulose or hexulose) kinase